MVNSQLSKSLKRTFKVKFRNWLYKRRLRECGDSVFFDKNVAIMRFPQLVSIATGAVIKEGAKICPCNASSAISIGENTTVGYHTFIFASEKITIGNNCLIAPFVYLVDSEHGINKNERINLQPNSTAEIIIGNDVWIGTGAKILKGVTIGNGAVIAAGAIVKDNVEPYSIMGGIPAKKISERK